MKKATLATLKSFDGMTDCVERCDTGYSAAKPTHTSAENTLGIAGVWLVGSSRDRITRFEDDTLVGINVYNCCGSFSVAVKKEA